MVRGNTNKDEFDILGGANKKLTYTGKRQFRGFEMSVRGQGHEELSMLEVGEVVHLYEVGLQDHVGALLAE